MSRSDAASPQQANAKETLHSGSCSFDGDRKVSRVTTRGGDKKLWLPGPAVSITTQRRKGQPASLGPLWSLAERGTVNQTGVTVAVRTCLEPANSSAATSSSCLNNETGTDAPGLELQVSFQQLVEVAENPTPTTEPVSPSLHRDF